MSSRPDRVSCLKYLAAWFAIMVAGIVVTLTPDTSAPLIPPPGATTDADLFDDMVNGVRAGGSYYDVTHKALLARGYPSRSLINWRTPALTCLLAYLPSPSWGKPLLALLASATFLLLFVELKSQVGTAPAFVGGFALFGSLAWCLGEKPYLFTDTWSGVLIALSMILLARGRIGWGVVAGFLALGFRELAIPYVLGSLGYAVVKRNRRETIAWCLAISLYLILMSLHAREVFVRLGPEDQALPGGWVRFGGLRFVLVTSQMNLFLMSLPLAATSFYLSLSLVGLFRSANDLGRRAGVILGLYLVAFSIVGAPFNFYWGLLTAPLLAIGFTQAVDAFPKLAAGALQDTTPLAEVTAG